MLRTALDAPGALHHPLPQDGAPPRRRRARSAIGLRGPPAAQRATARSACSAWASSSRPASRRPTSWPTEGIAATVWDVRVVSPPDPDMLADAGRPRARGHRRGRRPPRRRRRLPGRRHDSRRSKSQGRRGPVTRVLGVPRHTSPRARPTTSSTASASTGPASPRACAGRRCSRSPATPAPDLNGPVLGRLAPLARTKSLTA